MHSLLFHFEVYVFGAENDASRSGDRVRTKRFFSSLFVLRSETLTDAVFVWLLLCCFIEQQQQQQHIKDVYEQIVYVYVVVVLDFDDAEELFLRVRAV